MQNLEKTKQLQALQTEQDLMKVQVQALEETRHLLEKEHWSLWSESEKKSLIVMSESAGKEGEPELQFYAFPVETKKIKSQQHPIGAPQITKFTTYYSYTQAELVELGK